jgi:alanine racemase
MTHFSSTREVSSSVMAQQIERFLACHALNPERAISVANSVVLIARPELRVDWVRPGIMLYGENPLAADFELPRPLRAVMTLRARVIAVREIAAGESVGYDGCWSSSRPSRIATLGIGYGDGYPRLAGNGTPVCINGQRAELVGRVSMDSIAIDVTDCADVAVADEATLWGPKLPVATIADCARTTSYQLFTGVGQRVSREYID